MTSAAQIRVAIDELVLEGFDPRDRIDVAEAAGVELARLLAGAGTGRLAEPRRLGRIDGGAFIMARLRRPADIGAAVGRSLYGVLTGGAPE
jgi:hypothetical protein